MSLSDQAKEATEAYNKLEKVLKNMGKNIKNIYPDLKVNEQTLQEIKDLLKNANRELEEQITLLSSIDYYLKKTIESQNQQNIGLNTAKESYSRINSLADQMADHQLKISKLSKDDLTSINEKLQKEKQILRFNRANLYIALSKAKAAGNEEEIAHLEDAIKKSKMQSKALKNTQNLYEQLSEEVDIYGKKVGHTTEALSGVVGVFENLGLTGLSKTLGLEDAVAKMQEVAQLQADIEINENAIAKLQNKINSGKGDRFSKGELKILKGKQKLMENEAKTLGANNGKLSVYAAGLKSITNNFSKNAFSIASLIKNFNNAIIATDKGAGDLAKSFSLSYDSALETRRELGYMAAFSGDVALNTGDLQKSLIAVGSQLGINAKLNDKDLITMTKLVQQAGYTHEELMGITILSQINGKSLENNTKEVLGTVAAFNVQNKLMLNEKEILKEVSKTSAAIKLSLGGSTTAITNAVIKAKQFGLTLEQASKISEGLLQFESSIENELSAELLLGKDLNFEKARLLALNNDVAGAAAEIAKQVGSSADFANMNAIQQEAIAAAAGLTKEELAQSLVDREAIAAMSDVEGKSAAEKYNNLRKTMTAEQAAAKLGDEGLARQLEQQSIQERMNTATEKFKDIFMQVAEPVLKIISPLMNLVTKILPLVNILLQPIIWAFTMIADVITYAVESASKLVGLFTGATKEMSLMETIVGIIAGTFILIKGTMFAILGYQKIGNFLTGGLVALNKMLEASSVRQASTGGVKLGLDTSLLSILGLQNAARAYSLTQTLTGNNLTAIRAAMEQTILSKLILQGLQFLGNIAKNVILVGLTAARAAAETVSTTAQAAQSKGFIGLIAKGAAYLAIQIATAAAAVASASALTLGIAGAIAIASTIAILALINSSRNANDMVSKGDNSSGYGKRMLFGPEGAIKLNNKDTIVAGTDLFKKGDDVAMGPPNSFKETSQQVPYQDKYSKGIYEESVRRNNIAEQAARRDRNISTIRVN